MTYTDMHTCKKLIVKPRSLIGSVYLFVHYPTSSVNGAGPNTEMIVEMEWWIRKKGIGQWNYKLAQRPLTYNFNWELFIQQ